MESKKRSFIMYPTDFLAAVHNFSKRETGELIIALCEFNLYEKVSLKIPDAVREKFDVLQKIIEDNNAKYLEICEKRKVSAKQKTSKSKAKAKQTESKTLTKSQNCRGDNESEEEEENESESDNDNCCRKRGPGPVDNSGIPGVPDEAEVEDYCKKLGMAVDVPAFMSWHKERGWRHGNKCVAAEWKKAVREWFCNDKGISPDGLDEKGGI